MKPRVAIVNVLQQITQQQRSMNQALPPLIKSSDARDIGFIKDACFGVSRWYFQLKAIETELLHKPLRSKDSDVSCLILLGLYQLLYSNTPDYAVVSEAVSTCKDLKKNWASALVNKVLRKFIKTKTSILKKTENNEASHYAHPEWFILRLKKAWPKDWQSILISNNQKPPLTLRINQQKNSRNDYFALLNDADISAVCIDGLDCGITLTQPIPTKDIPQFSAGFCSVQDAAGQFAAMLLDLKKGQSVLDACAAPGSKACHILEIEPNLSKLTMLDKDAERLKKIRENITRLNLTNNNARLITSDATEIKTWWDGQAFDRILLDAPCSATGVIRRHPDIKLLRKDTDIEQQTLLQKQLLSTLWALLKPHGKLLYATCSVLPDENEAIISDFLQHTDDAKEINFILPFGTKQKHGWQILPSEHGPDGFYYCLLEKNFMML